MILSLIQSFQSFFFQCNEIDFSDITREEAVLILLALPDDVSLVVESKREGTGIYFLWCH